MATHEITFGPEGLHVTLRGLGAAGALRRHVHVPYAAIRSVSTEPFPLRPLLWRLGGVAVRRLHVGTFRRRGEWLFLAFADPANVVRLRLDGRGPERVRFSEVVLGASDPAGLAARIEAGRGASAPVEAG
jgi:hypothetical protein